MTNPRTRLAGVTQKNEPKTEVIMSRLTPVQTNGATSELKRTLKHSRLKLDEAPRFLQVMANSPASLEAYIRADAALERGQLTPRQRQQVALAVAEINASSWNLSARYDAGKRLGLTHQAVGTWSSRPGAPIETVAGKRLLVWPDFPRWRDEQLREVRDVVADVDGHGHLRHERDRHADHDRQWPVA